MLMACCHYLQGWDAAQVLSAKSAGVCLVNNRWAVFYMPLLIFPRPALMPRSKDNWQFMILHSHLMSGRGEEFKPQPGPDPQKHTHTDHSPSLSVIIESTTYTQTQWLSVSQHRGLAKQALQMLWMTSREQRSDWR